MLYNHDGDNLYETWILLLQIPIGNFFVEVQWYKYSVYKKENWSGGVLLWNWVFSILDPGGWVLRSYLFGTHMQLNQAFRHLHSFTTWIVWNTWSNGEFYSLLQNMLLKNVSFMCNVWLMSFTPASLNVTIDKQKFDCGVWCYKAALSFEYRGLAEV